MQVRFRKTVSLKLYKIIFPLKVKPKSLNKNHELNLPKIIVSTWDTIDKHSLKNKINTKSISMKVVAPRKYKPEHTQCKWHKTTLKKEIK